MTTGRENSERDPRFYRLKAKAHKFQVDSRFKRLFREDEKKSEKDQKKSIDKYGRKKEKNSEIKDLKRFYNLSEDESQNEPQIPSDSNVEDFSNSSGSESENSHLEQQSTIDFLMEHVVSQNPLVNTQVQIGNATKRLSLINLDWDQIKAVDIFVLLNGFKPVTGLIKSVKIYPSEFGKERLLYENLHGPMICKKDISKEKNNEEEEVIDYSKRNIVEENKRLQDEERGFDEIELRKYQLERLKYFFAIVECDSVETAATLYKQCDGLEFEKSANFIDLRYVPEGEVFDEESLHDYCDDMPVSRGYKTKANLVTSALQNSRVKLTWDADDISRMQALQPAPSRKRGKVDWNEEDLDAYLASASSADEDNIEEYRKKLLEADDEEDVFGSKHKKKSSGVEVTFTSPFDIDNEKEFSFQMPADKKEDKKEKSKKSKKSRKESEEKDTENTNILSNILLPERLDKANQSAEVNVNDPRFNSLYESHEFAIDPTHKSFKKTPGMRAILQEKQKRRK
jgi:hypothetical protein